MVPKQEQSVRNCRYKEVDVALRLKTAFEKPPSDSLRLF